MSTIKSRHKYNAQSKADDQITINAGSRRLTIEPEHLESAWSSLQNGYLTRDQFPSSEDKKAKTYLFPILAQLPYVGQTEIKKAEWPSPTYAHALYFSRRGSESTTLSKGGGIRDQLCLSLENER
jgi:hypothetical protein